jgi:hypothetical protein
LPAGKYPVPWRHSEEGADKHTKTKHRCSRVREFPGKWPPKGGTLSMPARMNKRMNRGWPAAVAPGPSPCACRPSLMRTSHPPREAPPDHSSALLGSRMPGTGRPVVPPPPSLLPPRLRWCLARHRGCRRALPSPPPPPYLSLALHVLSISRYDQPNHADHVVEITVAPHKFTTHPNAIAYHR